MAVVKGIKGVEILLAHRTRVPGWLKSLKRVRDVIREVEGKAVRCIQIRGGRDALFIPGGSVDIRYIPGFRPMALALFGPGQVLEIRDLATDELVKRNHYCCPKCIALTGFYLEKLEKKAPAGREWWAMGCRDCGESWETLR